MQKNELIRINRDLSVKLRAALVDYDFDKDLVEFILSEVYLDEYSTKLASKLESD